MTPDQCQGSAVVMVVTCSTSCTSVVVWPSPGLVQACCCCLAPAEFHSYTALQSAVYTGAHHSLPPCQQQQGQLKLTVTQFVLLQYDIQCSVKQIQIPTVQMELERPPAADIVNI